MIDNLSTQSVPGTFSGLSDGAIISADGFEFQIHYNAGDGNDVRLTAIPEPQTWAMMVAGLGMLLVLQRSRSRNPISGSPGGPYLHD